MALTIKYYSFKEYLTGNLSKDYGWDVDVTTNSSKIQIINDVPVVIRDEAITRVSTFIPRGTEVTEISQEVFAALDVSSESMRSTLRRESRAQTIAKLQAQQNIPRLSIQEKANRFGAFHKKAKK